jgi:hypothetical protein
MRYAVAILAALAFISTAAWPSAAPRRASEQEILATVKRLSAKDCEPRSAGSLQIVGCDYAPAFIGGEWQVLVIYALNEGGKRTHPSGGNLYILNAAGDFIKIVRGM